LREGERRNENALEARSASELRKAVERDVVFKVECDCCKDLSGN